jgi:hypothetical protein
MTLVGGAAAWPLAAYAQQSAMPTVGFVSSRAPGESAGVVAAFRQGLSETGFVEGQNLAIAFRWAEGHYERLPALTAELVKLRVAVLLAKTTDNITRSAELLGCNRSTVHRFIRDNPELRSFGTTSSAPYAIGRKKWCLMLWTAAMCRPH